MKIDTLLIAIVQSQDADAATHALNQAHMGVTRISSLGGFLEIGNVTLLVGLAREDVDRALAILAAECHARIVFVNASPQATLFIAPVEAQVGGATVFILPVERALQLREWNPATDTPTDASDIKLILGIIPDQYAATTLSTLTRAGYRATRISTVGGFWRRGNATLLVGVPASAVPAVITLMHQSCPSANAAHAEAGAVVFVLHVERFERI